MSADGAAGGRDQFKRLYCVATGAVLPVVVFVVAFYALPGRNAHWQSGRLEDWFALLISGPGSRPFHPLLAWSIASLACHMGWPRLAARSFVVRWGLYAGVLLAVQFGGMLGWIMCANARLEEVIGFGFAAHCAALVPATAAFAMATGRPRLGGVLWVLSYLALMLCCLPFFLVLIFAPWWTLGAYSIASVDAARAAVPGTRGRDRVLVIACWVVALSVTWRAAWLRAVLEYEQLPTTPPGDCFVATAAANGHARLVGPRVHAPNGRVLTRQLLRLKGLELAVATGWPSLHRRFRAVYDVVGPVLARRIRPPWAADVAWLCLKPAEALAALVLVALAFRPRAGAR